MSCSALVRRSLLCARVQSRGQLARPFSSSARRNEHFLNVDTNGFEQAVSKDRTKDKVVLVDFYADWCNPCKMLSPILEKLTKDESVQSGSGHSIDLVTVDTDAQVQLAMKYKIHSLPTVIAFKDGEPISQFMGALPEDRVRNFLKSI